MNLTVAALGGQGGGVLSTWLVDAAESEGYLVQSTSVPGVAQRTGATIYYLEFFRRDEPTGAGREPVMALMPTPGDVDCVVAAELVEAGRAVLRGLVTPDRTTLLASSHRDYTIAERTALGRGITDDAQILHLVRAQAKRSIVFDMAAVARRHDSVMSAVLLGAIGGSGVLPFRRDTFEAAIRRSGLAVDINLAAFADAWQRAATGGDPAPAAGTPAPPRGVEGSPPAALRTAVERIRRMPAPMQPLALTAIQRLVDYQDAAYADLFLDRVEAVVRLEAQLRPGASALGEAAARSLALWMTFEDTIRIADLKTRAERFARVGQEAGVSPDEWPDIVEFLHPRVEEIAGTLPARWGGALLRSPTAVRIVARFTHDGRQVRTSSISGFVMLRLLAALRPIRRRTLRYAVENEHIEQWLDAVHRVAPRNLPLAVEVARLQRLVKGYGDTHQRGERNFAALMALVDDLAARADGAATLARLHEAALADEEGTALAREMAAIGE